MRNLEELKKKLVEEYGNDPGLLDWVGNGMNPTHAITLTFAKEECDEIVADRVLGVCLAYVNERLFRRAYTSGKKKLNVFVTQEGRNAYGARSHFHLAIEMPGFVNNRRLREEFQYCWDKANMTRETERDLSVIAKKKRMSVEEVYRYRTKRENLVEIKPYRDIGWIGYAIKEAIQNDTGCISQYCSF